jgi:dTDP-4-amino-4,6-dideoxygalactose transaminase
MKFTIDVTNKDRNHIYNYFDDILSSQVWSEGKYLHRFEDAFGAYVGRKMVATNSWAGAALAVMEYLDVKGSVVLVPSNTFMATPLAAIKSGARVEFVDCNRNDLCMSSEDLELKIEKFKPKVVIIVHIGGHIAFEIHDIVKICNRHKITLIEDCAHAHGAQYRGKKAGTFGLAGIYSFYSTKTMTTGEGGCIVSNDEKLISFARQYINYGKPKYKVQGLNFRMNEFNAALGLWQIQKLPEIVNWKNKKAREYDKIFKKRVVIPKEMISGYYKYIVFQPIENSTGKVYAQPCHKILQKDYHLPNTEWVAKNHWCVPIFYKGDGEQT